MVSKVIYGESLSSSSGEDDQITTTIQPEAIPEEDIVQEKSGVSYNNNNKTSTSLPSLIGNIVTHLGKQTKSLFLPFFLAACVVRCSR